MTHLHPDRGAVQAVVFDLDGTLYDQRPVRRRMVGALATAVARGAERLRTPRLLQRFRAHREVLAEDEARGIAARQYADLAAAVPGGADEVRAAVERWMHQAPLPYVAAAADPGAARLFADLRARGVAIAVVSDYPAEAKLAALGLAADVVVASEDPDVDVLKPHPAGILAALARLGVAPERALTIGDRSERDGAAARRAGTGFVRRVWRRAPEPGDVAALDALVGRVGRGGRGDPP